MKFQGFIGGSYKLKSVNVDAQECVNLYPETVESGMGKESQVGYLKSTPGLTEIIASIGAGEVRLLHRTISGEIFVVVDDKLYIVTHSLGVWTATRHYGNTEHEITAITNANPAVVTFASDPNITNGDPLTFGNIAGMTELNNQSYLVTKLTPTTYELYSELTSTITGITNANPAVMTIASDVGYQSGDIVSIADVGGITIGGNYTLTRLTGTTYELNGTNTIAGEVTITGVTKANPGVITTSAIPPWVSLSSGDEIIVSGVGGMTELNGNTYTITKLTSTTYEINQDTSGYTTYTSGGGMDGVYSSGGEAVAPRDLDSTAFGAYTTPNGFAVNKSEFFTFDTTAGRVYAKSFELGPSSQAQYTVFSDGSSDNYLYYKNGITGISSINNYLANGYQGVENSTQLDFADGYIIALQSDSNYFYVSDLDSPNFNALSFGVTEGNADKNVGMIVNHRYLWVFGERTTEIYVNTGNSDFPFQRVSGGFLERGCAAGDSIAKIDGVILWLGRDEFGQGSVFAAQGLSAQRISTHAIEQAISDYADISTASAYTYQFEGHKFYVLNFAEATWVYDLSTNLWHKRAYTNAGDLERHRSEFHIFDQATGKHIVSDYNSNNLYTLDNDVYTDAGAAITRLRSFPHASSENKKIFFNRLFLDMETGVGLDGGVLGSEPIVMLTWSNDGGHTWSDEVMATFDANVGGIGDYKKRVLWRRLGSSRDRIFRVKITDPVKVTLINADMTIKMGRY